MTSISIPVYPVIQFEHLPLLGVFVILSTSDVTKKASKPQVPNGVYVKCGNTTAILTDAQGNVVEKLRIRKNTTVSTPAEFDRRTVNTINTNLSHELSNLHAKVFAVGTQPVEPLAVPDEKTLKATAEATKLFAKKSKTPAKKSSRKPAAKKAPASKKSSAKFPFPKA